MRGRYEVIFFGERSSEWTRWEGDADSAQDAIAEAMGSEAWEDIEEHMTAEDLRPNMVVYTDESQGVPTIALYRGPAK